MFLVPPLHYTKEEILEAYFNLAPYGGNVEGVKAASLIYFHKVPGKLTQAEAILLSTIPQNPGKRRPDRDGNRGCTDSDTRPAAANQFPAAATADQPTAATTDQPPGAHVAQRLGAEHRCKASAHPGAHP